LNPPDGAKFAGVMLGEPEDLWLLSTDAGYGFTVRFKELITDRRAGKTVLTVPENSHVLAPASVAAGEGLVCVVSSSGKMLAFAVSEVPEMPRGKGVKLYDISSKKAAAREEFLTAITVVPPQGELIIHCAEKRKSLGWNELQEYRGARAQRGAVLTRGWRQVDRLESATRSPAA
jgi:topoisomerase-4 subunit A